MDYSSRSGIDREKSRKRREKQKERKTAREGGKKVGFAVTN